MSDAAQRLKRIKALTIAVALAYALSALAILATTSTQQRTAPDPAAGTVSLGQRFLGR